MPLTITVEDVDRFRVRDPRAQALVRERRVVREATSTMLAPVHSVAGERVALRLVPGGDTATHACPDCAADTPCHRALAAVDAEGTERVIAECEHADLAAKRATIR